MAKHEDLTGQKFGLLTVVQFSHIRNNGKAVWWCKCDCGKQKEMLADTLKSNKATTCGCKASYLKPYANANTLKDLIEVQNISMAKVAKMFNVDVHTIKYWAKKLGVKTGDRAEMARKNILRGKQHPFYGKKGEEHPAFGRKHTDEEIRKLKQSLGKGTTNVNWKGGKTKHGAGYVLVAVPNSGMGRCEQKLEHRLIMEKHLGRKLFKWEVVHHKNGIKTDNRIENLEVYTRAEHARLHENFKHIKERVV